MPVPIRPKTQLQESAQYLDYSFLANHMPIESKKKVVTASDQDANALMKIWMNAEKSNNKYQITSKLELSAREIMRLKANGFVVGNPNEVEFTDRGKKIITVMALGENNNFQNGKVDKSYKEILASMDKRGKDGYRIPKFASTNSNNIRL